MDVHGTAITRKSRAQSFTRRAAELLVAQAFLVAAVEGADPPGDGRLIPPLKWGDATTTLTIKGTITYGTIFRAEGRDPELLPPANAARVGATGTAPGGTNVDDGNLNYARGDQVSTALKGLFDIELKHEKFGAFVRARAWDDFAQRRDAVPFGNLPNNFAANAPLGDNGFSRFGRFSGGVLMDANVYGTFAVAGKDLFVRLGSQTVDWGSSKTTLLGGLEQINAIDYAARYRAGALLADEYYDPHHKAGSLKPEEGHLEGYIPVPALFARLDLNKSTSVEAFYLFRYQANELAGCGTFFALADYVPDGCDKVLAQPVTATDSTALAAGIFARRAPDVKPSDGGQYGVGVTHRVEGLGVFGGYFATYHSRRFSASAIKSTRTILGGTPLIPGDPGGENVRYFIEYRRT